MSHCIEPSLFLVTRSSPLLFDFFYTLRNDMYNTDGLSYDVIDIIT
jgi:hypothetical protein